MIGMKNVHGLGNLQTIIFEPFNGIKLCKFFSNDKLSRKCQKIK